MVGLEKLGDKLLTNKDYEGAIGEIVWLIVTLANQPILIHNYKNPNDKKELLTEDEVEILTTPQDLANFKDAITEALYKGVQRNIVSEETKNAVGE
jgi:hypothetical protein